MSDASKTSFTTPSDLEFAVSRVFSAPRELVYHAYTDSDSLAKWWGFDTTVEENDVTVGGSYRFVADSPYAGKTAFYGEYLEIDPPARLVQTFKMELSPDQVITNTIDFEDLGNGKTRVTLASAFATKEERDTVISYGAQAGADQAWDKLEAFLATQA